MLDWGLNILMVEVSDWEGLEDLNGKSICLETLERHLWSLRLLQREE